MLRTLLCGVVSCAAACGSADAGDVGVTRGDRSPDAPSPDAPSPDAPSPDAPSPDAPSPPALSDTLPQEPAPSRTDDAPPAQVPAPSDVSEVDPPQQAVSDAPEPPAPTEPQFEIVDAVDQPEGSPSVPEGSSAFFWSKGLGNWFVTSADGEFRDASRANIVPARKGSTRAYRVTSAEPPIAVALWVQMDHPGAGKVDLSEYAGIGFWARLESPRGELTLAFNASYQLSSDEPWTFSEPSLAVSDEWQQFVVLFDDYGVDPSAIGSIDFVVGLEGEAFDLWLDDLAFLCHAECP